MRDVAKQILDYNKGRIPSMLQLKYKGMREDAFRFYRGTCHLFSTDLHKSYSVKDPTRVWTCGDLHLENFGSYRGDNGQIYFDLNDFDEALLAPCTWELARLLVSIHVAGKKLGFNKKYSHKMAELFLSNYISFIFQGKPHMVEKDIAVGVVKDLLWNLEIRNRKKFLKQRIIRKSKKYFIRIDKIKTLKLEEKKKKQILDFFAKHTIVRNKKKYTVIDAAHRVAGTGSLGLERYALLTQENELPHKFHIFDLKEARESALKPAPHIKQPVWKNEAVRICEIQKRVQCVTPAFLSALEFSGKPFVLKKLQPTSDKVNLELCRTKKKRMIDLLITDAQLTASAHLRAGGRQSSSITDELIAFCKKDNWQKQLLHFTANYSEQVYKDYTAYCKKYDAGYFS